MLTKMQGVHAKAKIKVLWLYLQEGDSAQQQNILFRKKLKHLSLGAKEKKRKKEKLQAQAIWKSSSQISNFKKCSINCAVVIQCQ